VEKRGVDCRIEDLWEVVDVRGCGLDNLVELRPGVISGRLSCLLSRYGVSVWSTLSILFNPHPSDRLSNTARAFAYRA
jgi:hypothetical protein